MKLHIALSHIFGAFAHTTDTITTQVFSKLGMANKRLYVHYKRTIYRIKKQRSFGLEYLEFLIVE